MSVRLYCGYCSMASASSRSLLFLTLASVTCGGAAAAAAASLPSAALAAAPPRALSRGGGGAALREAPRAPRQGCSSATTRARCTRKSTRCRCAQLFMRRASNLSSRLRVALRARLQPSLDGRATQVATMTWQTCVRACVALTSSHSGNFAFVPHGSTTAAAGGAVADVLRAVAHERGLRQNVGEVRRSSPR